MFVLVGLIGCGLALLRGCHYALTHFESGEGVPSVSWLPESAPNVSYYKSYLNTAFEFDISEAEFLRWSSWEVQPIKEPVGMLRYCYFTTSPPDYGPNPTQAQEAELLAIYNSQRPKIDDGWYYGYRQSNGGGVWVAYDRSKGRAYFRSAPR